MILATMAAISREVLLVIPKELRTGSMSLGATRQNYLWSIVASGISGIIGAAILAPGRALGETMAVTMVIGNSPTISSSLLELATPSQPLANEFGKLRMNCTLALNVSSFNFVCRRLLVCRHCYAADWSAGKLS